MKKIGLMCLGLLASCGVPEELYNARVADLNRVQQELSTAEVEVELRQREVGDLRNRNELMKSTLEAAGEDVNRLEGERGRMKELLEDLRRQRAASEARAATYRELLEKLKGMIDAGKLQVEIRNGRMLVKMSDKILFDTGKTKIKPEGKAALKELTTVLAQLPDRRFEVSGHTDNKPIRTSRFPSNWELSTARGVEVLRFMASSGMDASRMSAAGYADKDPVGSNDTDEGRTLNRRIEITLQPNINELPTFDEPE